MAENMRTSTKLARWPFAKRSLQAPEKLPPGRFKLATGPIATQSAPTAKITEMVVVAALAARAEGVPHMEAITVTNACPTCRFETDRQRGAAHFLIT
jgi:hypothetical protein